MQFTINRERILGLAEDLLVVVPSRIITTATSGFLIEVDPEGGLKMCATDLTFILEARSTVEETDGRLRVIVPAQRFVNALKYMTGETIDIVSQGWTHNIQLTDGASNIRLSVIAEDFPNVSLGEDNTQICDVDADWLRNSVTQLEFAAEHNEKLNAAMNSILIDCNGTDKNVTVVAGKGSMICKRTSDVYTANSDSSASFTLPRTAIRILKTVLKGADTCTIRSNSGGTKMVVDTDTYSAAMPLKAVTYPNYAAMFSRKSDCTTTVTINRDDMKMALLRATVVLPGQANESSPIQLNIHETNIDLNMTSAAGAFTESIAARKEGQALEILFDLKKFSDSINVMPDEEVVLKGSTRSSPFWIISGDTELIIMPQIRGGQ